MATAAIRTRGLGVGTHTTTNVLGHKVRVKCSRVVVCRRIMGRRRCKHGWDSKKQKCKRK